MQIKDVMSAAACTAAASDSVKNAATLMVSVDADALPVVDGPRCVGLLTRRDVIARIVVQERDASRTPVDRIMSREPTYYCYDDDDGGLVQQQMARQQMRCLAVVGRDKTLLGVVTLEDLLGQGDSGKAPVAAAENALDEALEETFPASDPISPA